MKVAFRLENYYILITQSTIKLTYVRSVPEEGTKVGKRDEENGKLKKNILRAKTTFLDIGQCNNWDYMGTFTSGSENPEKDIRGFLHWINDLNYNHGWRIRYLAIFELGDKGRRIHAHVLLKDVPKEFIREYSSAEYAKLPKDLKRLYSEYKTETGTRLAMCPWWRFGWSTLIPVDGSPKVVSYMSKYMTKQNIEFTTKFGKQSFFASKGLIRPLKQKIPTDIAGTMWRRVPSGSWYKSFFGDNGTLLSCCYIIDKDKIPSDLWDYYNQVYNDLQSYK